MKYIYGKPTKRYLWVCRCYRDLTGISHTHMASSCELLQYDFKNVGLVGIDSLICMWC